MRICFQIFNLQVYNVDSQVPDSAGTGAAYLTGVKTNLGVIGVDHHVKRNNCSSMNADSNLDSIAKWSQDVGKRTGIIRNINLKKIINILNKNFTELTGLT